MSNSVLEKDSRGIPAAECLLTVEEALSRLEPTPGGKRFVSVLEHGSLLVEIYAPRGVDPQTPHTRDEVYIVVRGSGVFRNGQVRQRFAPGDLLFVPAGREHRFEFFTDDLVTWVIFYGPEGGEAALTVNKVDQRAGVEPEPATQAEVLPTDARAERPNSAAADQVNRPAAIHAMNQSFSGLTIRGATNMDVGKITALVFDTLKEHGLNPDPQSKDADLFDIEGNYLKTGGMFEVIEDMEGNLVGTVGLYPLDQQTCELRKMYFAQSIRGRGLGRALLERAVNRARELGFKRITLETISVLDKAIRLYTRFGFKPLEFAHPNARADQSYFLDL